MIVVFSITHIHFLRGSKEICFMLKGDEVRYAVLNFSNPGSEPLKCEVEVHKLWEGE